MRLWSGGKIKKHICFYGFCFQLHRLINRNRHSWTEENHVVTHFDSQREADTCSHGSLHSSPGSPGGRAFLPCPGWRRRRWITEGWRLQFPWTRWGPPAPTLLLPGGMSPPAGEQTEHNEEALGRKYNKTESGCTLWKKKKINQSQNSWIIYSSWIIKVNSYS